MKLAFYKAKDRLFNQAVSFWLRGPYSHVELVLGENAQGDSICLSSSLPDGGVRIKHMPLPLDRWDLVPVTGDVRHAYEWAAAHMGQGYDLRGLLGFVWRREEGDKDKWFCSELCAAVLGMPEPWRFDPMTLWAAVSAQQPLPNPVF